MLNLSRTHAFILCALIIGLSSALLATFSLLQVQSLSLDINKMIKSSSFDHFIDDNSYRINNHIDLRIDNYIDRVKQEKVAEKYEPYELAVKWTNSGNHIYGNETARFTLVEYSDLECPYCKRYHSVPKRVVDLSDGLVAWQWKHFPLPFHNPVAAIEAQASECIASIAGNRAFWVYLQSIFDETKGNGQGAGDLVNLAQSIGIDEEKYTDCINTGKFRDKVAADRQHATELGITSTPVTYIVDNSTGQSIRLRGLQTPETIASTIQRMKKSSTVSLHKKMGG